MSPVVALRRRLSLRARVAGAFALATALTLVALGTYVQLRVESALRAQLETSLERELEALLAVPAGRRPDVVAQRTGESFAQVLAADGSSLAGSPQLGGVVLRPPQASSSEATVRFEDTVRLQDEDEPEAALMLARETGGQTVVVGTLADDVEDASAGVLAALVTGVPLALLVATAAGSWVAGLALGPVERMRARAARISAGTVHERLPTPPTDDELGRLGRTLNAMLDRLEEALARERSFVAEASHELRTPLALLRTELDLALDGPRSPEELAEALRSASEEVERLSALAEDLLTLSAAEENRLELARTDTDLCRLLDDVARRFAPGAADQGRVVVVTSTGPVRADVDRPRMHQVTVNLVDNALRHGHGRVALAAVPEPDGVLLTVDDEGTSEAVPDDAVRPFARSAQARSGGGHGLGLAVSHAIVAAHGGELSLSSGPTGTRAAVRLPNAPRG